MRNIIVALVTISCAAALLAHASATSPATDPADIEVPPNNVVNPVVAPVEEDAAFVHTTEFAQLPEEDGKPAKIVSMQQNGPFLFVCTLLSVYRVSPHGHVALFLDVQGAIDRATAGARSLSLQPQHGGVRSVAFPPRFPRDPRFYVSAMESRPQNASAFHYISDVPNPIDTDSVLLEFRYNSYADMVDPLSYRLVFRVGMPVYDHPIKQMVFRRRRLFIAHGDGATQTASTGGGQNGDALGKILRIVPFEPFYGNRPYRVPRGNPFVDDPHMPDEVWALGFRNPHTLCFGYDGTLYIGETGRSNVEEVNIGRRGRNYGWSVREGHFASRREVGGVLEGIERLPDDDVRNGFTYPAAVYGHTGTVGKQFSGEAIAGGCPVENGSPMSGQFYYADFPTTGRLFFSAVHDLKHARTQGPPAVLTVARTKLAVVCLRRRNAETGHMETVRVGTLGNATRVDSGFAKGSRADVRFGRGRDGELYWSSKANGKIYVFTSSFFGGPSQPC